MAWESSENGITHKNLLIIVNILLLYLGLSLVTFRVDQIFWVGDTRLQ